MSWFIHSLLWSKFSDNYTKNIRLSLIKSWALKNNQRKIHIVKCNTSAESIVQIIFMLLIWGRFVSKTLSFFNKKIYIYTNVYLQAGSLITQSVAYKSMKLDISDMFWLLMGGFFDCHLDCLQSKKLELNGQNLLKNKTVLVSYNLTSRIGSKSQS